MDLERYKRELAANSEASLLVRSRSMLASLYSEVPEEWQRTVGRLMDDITAKLGDGDELKVDKYCGKLDS